VFESLIDGRTEFSIVMAREESISAAPFDVYRSRA
jgi:hypothetical protein